MITCTALQLAQFALMDEVDRGKYRTMQMIASAMGSVGFFGNSNDNDVHEHFKCLEKVARNKACVALRIT